MTSEWKMPGLDYLGPRQLYISADERYNYLRMLEDTKWMHIVPPAKSLKVRGKHITSASCSFTQTKQTAF